MSLVLLEDINLENLNSEHIYLDKISNDSLLTILNSAYDIFISENNRPHHLLRQYRNIKASSNDELDQFIMGNLNYINIFAHGSGYSTWWLYRNINNKKYFVNTTWQNIISLNDNPEIESLKNFQFQEVSDEKIFELKNF